jgi:transcriptional regulator with XRE-family HTH domain
LAQLLPIWLWIVDAALCGRAGGQSISERVVITRIREVRRGKGLSLGEVARRCSPPTTAQTIGRLETGIRTVSVKWLNRIAAAMSVSTADLVMLPENPEMVVAAIHDATGARAPRVPATIALSIPDPNHFAITFSTGVGDYRAGDEVWCERLTPHQYTRALNRDVIVPRPAGRFLFGRLIGRSHGKLQILPLGAGLRQQVVADPLWMAQAVRLLRAL